MTRDFGFGIFGLSSNFGAHQCFHTDQLVEPVIVNFYIVSYIDSSYSGNILEGLENRSKRV